MHIVQMRERDAREDSSLSKGWCKQTKQIDWCLFFGVCKIRCWKASLQKCLEANSAVGRYAAGDGALANIQGTLSKTKCNGRGHTFLIEMSLEVCASGRYMQLGDSASIGTWDKQPNLFGWKLDVMMHDTTTNKIKKCPSQKICCLWFWIWEAS